MEKNLCNCRFQLTDMGYFECCLEKNHEGNHKFNSENSTHKSRNYVIEWEKDEKKDIIIDMDWMKQNTNLFDLLDNLLVKYDFLSHYECKNPFSDAIHGSAFNCYCYFYVKKDIIEKFDLNDYEKYLDFLKPIYLQNSNEELKDDYFNFDYLMFKEVYDNLNIKIDDYDLFINVQTTTYEDLD